MIVLIAAVMGALAASLMVTGYTDSRNYLAGQRALFAAESGLEYVSGKLVSNSSYRNSTNFNPINLSIGSTAFNVTISRNGTGTIYTLNSTGNSQAAKRVVSRQLNVTNGATLPACFDYALALFNSGNLEIKGASYITGDVFWGSNNTLDVQKPGQIGNVSTANTTHVTGKASSVPDPLPEYSILDTSWYVTHLAAAAGSPTDLTIGADYPLGGNTTYCRDLTIDSGANFTGGGTIVACGKVTVNGGTVPADVTIVSNSTIDFNGAVSGGAVYYADGGVSLQGSNNVTGNILTPGNMTVGVGTPTITGLVYANKIKFNGTPNLIGSVVANSYDGTQITGNVGFVFNALPSTIPHGINGTLVTRSVIQNQSWGGRSWGEQY